MIMNGEDDHESESDNGNNDHVPGYLPDGPHRPKRPRGGNGPMGPQRPMKPVAPAFKTW